MQSSRSDFSVLQTQQGWRWYGQIGSFGARRNALNNIPWVSRWVLTEQLQEWEPVQQHLRK